MALKYLVFPKNRPAMIRLSYSPSQTFPRFKFWFKPSPFNQFLVKSQTSTRLLTDIFAPQKVPLSKISHVVIACDLWLGPPPIKILRRYVK